MSPCHEYSLRGKAAGQSMLQLSTENYSQSIVLNPSSSSELLFVPATRVYRMAHRQEQLGQHLCKGQQTTAGSHPWLRGPDFWMAFQCLQSATLKPQGYTSAYRGPHYWQYGTIYLASKRDRV